MAVTDQQFTGRFVGGVTTITFGPRSNRAVFTVTQVSVEYRTAPLGCTCELRKNGALITPMIPTGDAASGDPPVVLKGNDRMTVTFTNGTNGEIANVFIIYDDGSPE